MEGAHLTIKPARSGQILMGSIGAPLILFALGAGAPLALRGDVENAAYAVVPFLIGCWCVLEITTVRLHLSADRLWLSRWWHIRWSIPRERAELTVGLVGDVPLLPGLHVIDRLSGRKVGEIISGQFPPDDLEKLAALISRRDA